MNQNVSFFCLFCTITSWNPPQGSQSGPTFGKASSGIRCNSRAAAGLATETTLGYMNCPKFSVKFLVGISLVNVYTVSKICASDGFLRCHQKYWVIPTTQPTSHISERYVLRCLWYTKCILDLRKEVKETRRQLRQQKIRNLYYLLNTVKR